MKKILVTFLVLASFSSLFAQSKGDMFISGSISANLGTQNISLSSGGFTTTESIPLESSFTLGVEYGYFVANQLKIGLGLFTAGTSTPTESKNNKWLKNSTTAFGINPNLAYYVPISDNIHYTPEFGSTIEFGTYKEAISTSSSYKTPCNAWQIYLSLIGFEFKISDNFSIGASAGTLSYGAVIIKDSSTDMVLQTSQLRFDLNEGAISAKLYF